ncbi:MAG: trimeric intracellular cation channel family protein [Bacteroidales bacterium]|nr:trimeric intracellular cation channel family protein [Bacteroidales bacterium]
MEITFVDIIDYLGTFAFALSGIRLASAKQFDWFGAFIVGMATAVGGGTLRDVMLGLSPFWMTRWIYFAITGFALLLFVFFHRQINKIASTIFLFDTIGLGLFTVVGIQKTLDAGFPLWTANIMGMFTGAAGGVIRDILINEVPLIFRRDIYALACFAGGMFFSWGFLEGLPIEACTIGCAMAVIIIRLLAVMFHWQLPILHDHEEKKTT